MSVCKLYALFEEVEMLWEGVTHREPFEPASTRVRGGL